MPPDKKKLSRSVGGFLPLSKLATGGVKTQERKSRHHLYAVSQEEVCCYHKGAIPGVLGTLQLYYHSLLASVHSHLQDRVPFRSRAMETSYPPHQKSLPNMLEQRILENTEVSREKKSPETLSE